MDQIARIQYMEKTLDKSQETIRELMKALESYQNLQAELEELIAYYSGPLWRKAFEEDDAPKLPAALRRAVLSEDGALTDAVTYDVILNNNPNLARVVRVVTYADGSQKELSAEVFRTPALVTFCWADENSFIQNFNSETRVSQYFYDKDGNILMDE